LVQLEKKPDWDEVHVHMYRVLANLNVNMFF